MDKQFIEENLVILCKIMIEKFDQAKELRLITEEEYNKYTDLKFEFLQSHDK